MGYGRGLGESSDTVAARALHQAALSVVAARNSGNAASLAAAQRAFNAQAGANTDRVASLKEAELKSGGPLEVLQGILTGAGKWAALGIGLVLFGPALVNSLSRAGRRPLMNPGRRRRRRRGR